MTPVIEAIIPSNWRRVGFSFKNIKAKIVVYTGAVVVIGATIEV